VIPAPYPGRVSPRRHRRSEPPPPGGPGGRAGGPGRSGSGSGSGLEQVETWPDGDWEVRPVSVAAATKTYRCPGCDQEIRPGVAHLVTWPAGTGRAEDRRHWHGPCWRARDRRRTRIQRSRDAPRF
jgi:hypothetical protein